VIATVRLWWIDIELPQRLVTHALSVLDPAERAQAETFRFLSDRLAFVSRRAAYRQILSDITGVPPSQLCFEFAALGKPRLDIPAAPCFSTSRSGKRAVMAVANTEVGVDLEAETAAVDPETLVERILSAQELAAWWALKPEMRRKSFFEAWVCKEAVVKALGSGLSSDLRDFDLWRPEGPRLFCAGSGRRRWNSRLLEAPVGYSACLCCHGDGMTIEDAVWRWS
jgi:4'-phosphopantetheinyl transferase